MNKTLVISGGSSGIGLAIVKLFVANHYNVFNLDIQPSEVGTYIKCDITNHGEVIDTVAEINKNHAITTCIPNAGKHFSANIENTDESAFLDVFNLNVKGAFSMIQAVIPLMKKNNQGVITIIGSDQSSIAKKNSCAYNMSKHALASLAKTTAVDYAQYNIRSNIICPGTVETPLYHKAIDAYSEKSGESKENLHQLEANAQPIGRIGQPEEIASLALYLDSNQAGFITGAMLPIDGGYTTL